MLEHQKLLLEKLSTDKASFKKELIKSFMWLKSYEIFNLLKWVKEKYGTTHQKIIEDVYSDFYADV
jgi:hypothetical protein